MNIYTFPTFVSQLTNKLITSHLQFKNYPKFLILYLIHSFFNHEFEEEIQRNNSIHINKEYSEPKCLLAIYYNMTSVITALLTN